jgi:hypothetical protein
LQYHTYLAGYHAKGDQMPDQPETTENTETWATVELMGHAQTAGRISRPSDWGGLLRVDVPTGPSEYRTEFYGMAAIYSIKIVGEQIARAYAQPARSVVAYDTPIVTREQHQSVVSRLEEQKRILRSQVSELETRLTAVNALPAPKDDDDDAEGKGDPLF